MNSIATSFAPGTWRIEGVGVVAEIDFGISEVGDHPQAVRAGEGDDLLVEGEIGDISGRVGRIADHQHLGLGHGVAHRPVEDVEEVRAGRGRDRADRGAGDDEAELVDRIGGIGREHDVAGRGDRLGEVGEPLLRAQRHDHLAVGIELDPEAAGIISRPGPCAGRRSPSRPNSDARADCARPRRACR